MAKLFSHLISGSQRVKSSKVLLFKSYSIRMKTALRPYTYLDTPDDTAMETFSLQVEDLDYKVSNLMG